MKLDFLAEALKGQPYLVVASIIGGALAGGVTVNSHSVFLGSASIVVFVLGALFQIFADKIEFNRLLMLERIEVEARRAIERKWRRGE